MINNPHKSPILKFPEAEFLFDRIYIDFAGPFKGKTYLVIIDLLRLLSGRKYLKCLALMQNGILKD